MGVKQSFWKVKRVLAPKSITVPHSVIDEFGNEITDEANIWSEYKNEFKHGHEQEKKMDS